MTDPRDRQTRGDKRPKRPTHPKLTPKQDAAQRGEDPIEGVGRPVVPDFPDEDPAWVPDPAVADPWRDLIHQHGGEHRPHREDVLPYLLIRAFAPGDRARRPIWPPVPSWLSPDILLVDASWTGPFRADQVVGNPVAGRAYRVFVHAWNLGLLAAVGVHVRAWYVDPGFFSGTPGGPTPSFIGGAFVDLAPRTAPDAHRVVELQPPWSIPAGLTGHECLLAAVDCPADRWNGTWDANADRHVGQRNLTILEGKAELAPLLLTLGGALGVASFLELTLTAAAGREPLRYGLPIKGGRHLFVATKVGQAGRDGRLLIMPTTRLVEAFGEAAPDLSEPGAASRMFAQFLRRGGAEFQHDALDEALRALLDVPELTAERVGQALGGVDVALHLSAFGPEVTPSGGYTIEIAAAAGRKR